MLFHATMSCLFIAILKYTRFKILYHRRTRNVHEKNGRGNNVEHRFPFIPLPLVSLCYKFRNSFREHSSFFHCFSQSLSLVSRFSFLLLRKLIICLLYLKWYSTLKKFVYHFCTFSRKSKSIAKGWMQKWLSSRFIDFSE